MMSNKPLALAFALLLLPLSLPAQTKSGGEALYRCRGSNGQMHFGDSMPAECMGLDTEVLSARGTVLRTIEGSATQALKAKHRAEEEATRKAREDAELRDRMLVDTYLSVADIERLRDQRIELVKNQLRLDEQTLVSLKDREQRMLEQIRRFKPYSTKRNAGPVPDHLNEDMASIVNSKAITEKRVAEKRAEEQQLQNQFATDMRRFKELRGIK